MTVKIAHILTVLSFTACNYSERSNDSLNIDSSEKFVNNSSMQLDFVNTEMPVLQLDTDYLKTAKEFAENYLPDSIPNKGVGQLENIPENVVIAFRKLRWKNPKEHERYLTLIFIKLYRGHLQCCNQSYEVRLMKSTSGMIDSLFDPLLFEYNLLTNQFDNKHKVEFVPSSIGFDWTEKHKFLLQDTLIKREYELVLKLRKSIGRGEAWK